MAATVQTTTVTTEDGRELCVEIAGRGDRAVLIHNGTPNSRHLYRPWIEDAERRHIQLISYDRPGYGGSSAQPGHSVADGAGDVAAIARALGHDRLAVWGISGGGPYALACAALLPELVVASAALGSIAPWGAEGLDYFAGMGEDNVEDIQLYLSDPRAARQKAEKDRQDLLSVTADQVTEGWKSLVSEVDAAVMVGEFAEYLVEGFQDGLAPGVQGWWDDGAAHLAPWGFDFGAIQLPVKIFHGRHDRFVPFQHGQWLAAHVPDAEASLSETDGHLTLVVNRIPEVHEWLLAHL